MDYYSVPLGFGMALNQNTAAMIRYSGMPKAQQQAILDQAHNIHSREGMYQLVAQIANGTLR